MKIKCFSYYTVVETINARHDGFQKNVIRPNAAVPFFVANDVPTFFRIKKFFVVLKGFRDNYYRAKVMELLLL
jgi:hypothetical protein